MAVTTNRFKHIRALVELRQRLAENPAHIDELMCQAIWEALPPQYRKVQRFVKSHKGDVPSSMVSTAFRLNQNHSASILNELWQFGLLDRKPDTNENGKRFLYS